MPALIYAEQEGGLISVVVEVSDDGKGILSDRPEVLQNISLTGGKAVHVVDVQTFLAARGDLQGLVSAHTGKVPPSPNNAIVDRQSGVVLDVIAVYPSTFPLAETAEFVPTMLARKGDRYLSGQRTDDAIERVIAEKAAAALAAQAADQAEIMP